MTTENRPRTIRSLTGLRGVAAVAVLLYHMSNDLGSDNLAISILRHGYLCVDLFFILSGFVMTLTYGSTLGLGVSRKSYLAFLGHRLARVYPLYLFLTLFAFLALHGSAPRAEVMQALIPNVALVQVWGISRSLLPNSWSISAEWLAYLLFPFAAPALMRGRRPVTVAASISVLALLLLAFAPQLPLWASTDQYRSGTLDRSSFQSVAPLARCLSEFVLGVAVCRIIDANVLNARTRSRISAIAGIGLLLSVLLGVPDFVIVCLFCFLILGLSADEGHLADLLASPPVYFVGTISYSIYLVQDFTLGQGPHFRQIFAILHVPTFHGIVSATIICATIVLSFLTFTLIEKPARRLLRRIGGGAIPKPAAP